jgi:phosphoribosylaminoimidazole (AIR) synthetase
MTAIVARADASRLIRSLADRGVAAAVVGEVVTAAEAGGATYQEGPLGPTGGSEAGR